MLFGYHQALETEHDTKRPRLVPTYIVMLWYQPNAKCIKKATWEIIKVVTRCLAKTKRQKRSTTTKCQFCGLVGSPKPYAIFVCKTNDITSTKSY